MRINRAARPTKFEAPKYSRTFSHPAPVRCYPHLIASCASALALLATAITFSIN